MTGKNIHRTSPELIFKLRESSFANDLFITAVSYFDFFNFLKKHQADFDNISKSLKIKKRPLDVMLTLFKAYGFIVEKDNKYYLSNVSDDYLTNESSFDLSSYVSSLKDRPTCEEMKKALLMFLTEGKCYSTAEMKDVLEEAGFKHIQYRPTILNRSIITGIKLE